ncbi:aromatic ring-hydroxylating oxygenase subunit alpha [Stenotrophomonas rhizophila]|uniref:aromatic ring-hydroxylating oxygenase subunit alpha n=1 Tax=Stenotrophomonas rhizophila TaxID=216778 RepID=UPI001E4D3B54|nr:SRPBCC family protein [Stenotrophomonas rhizophila]MCC7633976.1 Rieske 2Fe-2S domain-containing protein [Stenotrophomonas rhizophila]MCC7663310.1 Rieske 2Fe-2S domain-containing protein [Stenotrophomonas rhizophila]
MQHDRQVAIIERIFAHLDAKTTDMCPAIGLNPVEAYFSDAWQASERRHLFGDRGQLLGLSGLLRHAGDYLVDDLGGGSRLLVRTPAGPIHGFHNVCRHRGAPLVQAGGEGARAFTCRYHGWSYDLDGMPMKLHAAHYPPLAAHERQLAAIGVDEAHGLVWVHRAGAAATDLHGLEEELDAYRLQDFFHYQSRRLQRRMNWKMVIDTFLESAHFPFLHRDSIASLFIHSLGIFDAFGDHCRMVYPRKTIDTLRGTDPRHWDLLRHSIIIYLLFPNTLLIWQLDHVEIWRTFPDPVGDPAQCVAEVSMYIPQQADSDKARAHWDANMRMLIRAVDEEDFPVAEAVQRGLRSGAQPHLTFGCHEPGLIHFHQRLQRAMVER